MRGLRHGLTTAWRVVRAEGVRSAVDRARDRLAERGERRRAVEVAPGGLAQAPVLNVVGMPLSSRLGGVPTQLRNRLGFESGERPCAVLHPHGQGWRIDYLHCMDRRALASGHMPLDDAIQWGLRETNATTVHLEGLAGMTGNDLGALARVGARLVISVHDYSVFCRRTHLIERPADRFCHYCRDLDRCQDCLRRDFDVEPGAQARYRERTAALLRSAAAVVFPSRFLRDVHADLVPGLEASRLRAIEPGTPPVPGLDRKEEAAVRHVAWVGAVQVYKGALVLEDVVREVQAEGPRLRWSALGGGDAQLLARFRRVPGMKVRGYWRSGTLPAVLRRRDVDLALLLSVAPEAYGLTLDECWRAGVPAIAFDHGAMAERVRRLGGGAILVPPGEGARGIARAVRQAVEGPPLTVPAAELLPEPRHAAAAHLELYRDLRLVSGRSA
jgi:glycosyltransferase involved in cell wall biosynthesis